MLFYLGLHLHMSLGSLEFDLISLYVEFSCVFLCFSLFF